jgi:rRNA maturation endonuclease Nob1
VVELSLTLILVLVTGVPLLIIATLALLYTVRSFHRPLRHRESIYECSNCGHVYAIARNRPMDRCPQCGHLNEAVRV